MNDCEDIFKLQQLLYQYIDSFEYRSLGSIYDACNNLTPHKEDESDTKAAWLLFYPLLYSGVVDFIGKNKYAITEPLILFNNKNYFYINCRPSFDCFSTPFVGIVSSDCYDDKLEMSPKTMDAMQILKNIPSIKTIVESYSNIYTEDKFDLYDFSWKKSLATINGGFARYLYIPEPRIIKRVPNRETNPESSFRIPYCYSRVLNNEVNGVYNSSAKTLKMKRFAMPIMIYRVLLLNSLNNNQFPINEGEFFVFDNVTKKVASEINRIFNNSISYE